MAATYYITVLPETSKFASAIEQAGRQAERNLRLRPTFDTAGAQQAGQQAGRQVQAGIDAEARGSRGLGGFLSADGASGAGRRAGQDFNAGLQSANVGSGIDQQLRANATGGEAVGREWGSALARGLKTTATVGAAAAVGGLGYVLTKGFGRLTEIDTAQYKLQALGNDATKIKGIMENATTAVTGTSFALNEAATTSASAVAAGIQPGQQLTQYLTTTADAAAVAGTSLSEMGSIMNKVQTSNKAYTGDLQMLSDRGLPIFKWIGDAAGKSADDVAKMAKEGQISAKMFQDAIQKNIGGAAQKMGGSFMGALANLKAAIGRFGAGLAGPIVEGLRPLLGASTKVFDGLTKAMGPSLKGVTANVKAWSEDLSTKITAWAENGGVERAAARISQVWNTTVNGLRAAASWVKQLWEDLRGTGGGADPGQALSSVGEAARNIGSAAKDAGPALKTVGESIVAMGPDTIRGVLVPAFQILGGAMKFAADNASWVVPLAGSMAALGIAAGKAAPFVQAYTATINLIRTPIIAAQTAVQWGLTRALTAHTAALAANTQAQGINTGATNAGFLAATKERIAKVASTVAEKARTAATKAGAAAQWLFNAAMNANPLVLLVTALVAVGVALWAFFTKTEAGRKLWDKIWNGIKAITNGVVAWFRNTALPFLSGFFTKVGEVAMWLWHNVITPVWDGIKITIGIAIEVIKGYIEGWMIAFRVIDTVLKWVWNSVVVPIFNGIKGAISVAVEAVKAIWNTLVSNAESVWTGVRDRFTSLVNFVKELPGKITAAAKGMWDGISGAFKSMVNGLIDMWNGLASKLSFTVPDIVGFPRRGEKVSPIPTIGKLATGGIISGPGNGTSDDILALTRTGAAYAVSNGESVNTANATARYWPLYERLNAGQPLSTALRGLGLSMPAFAGGGRVTDEEKTRLGGGTVNYSLLAAVRAQFPNVRLTSGYSDHPMDGGYHQKKMAIDLDNKDEVAAWLFANRSALNLGQIIYGGGDGQWNYYNIGGTEKAGKDAIPIFGNDVVFGQHSDHIHVMANGEVTGNGVGAATGADGVYDGTGGGGGGTTTYGNAGGASRFSSASDAKAGGVVPVWVDNWPSTIGAGSGGGGGGTSISLSGGNNSSSTSTSSDSSSTTATGASALGSLTASSSKQEIAAAIIGEANRRGYKGDDAVAILSTALQESGLNPSASGGGGAWKGVFQQDSSYEGREDPNKNIAAFFDRLDEKAKGSGASSDIWKNIFWLQQAPGAKTADAALAGGRQAYLTEIQSQLNAAKQLAGSASSTPTVGTSTSPSATTTTSTVGTATSATGTNRKATDKELAAAAKKTSTKSEAVTQAQQSVEDHEYAVTQAKKRLEEVQAKTKQTNSKGKPLADADDVAKAERSVTIANRELVDAKKRLTKATGNATEAQQAEADLKTKGVAQKSKSSNSTSSSTLSGSDLGKAFVSGIFETIGLDGSVFSNPFEWPTVKSILAGVNALGKVLQGGTSDSTTDSTSGSNNTVAGGIADTLGLGNFVKQLPSPVGAATSNANKPFTAESGSPKLAQDDFIPTVAGSSSAAQSAAAALTAFAPAATAVGQQQAAVDNRITVNAPGQNAEQIYTKVRTEQAARTRTTQVRG